MNSIPQSDDSELETKIADVVATTTSLVTAIQSARPSRPKKKQLRQAFAELAQLKAQRHPSVIHKLDFENGALVICYERR